jgi:hypothetical protein
MNNCTTDKRGRQLAVAAPADQTVEEEQKLQESEADSKETKNSVKKGQKKARRRGPVRGSHMRSHQEKTRSPAGSLRLRSTGHA